MKDVRTKKRRSPEPAERQRDPDRTRQALLDAALHEFADKGLAGARVSEIAARAGVNKQLISYYFGGKHGLYRALGERWLAHESQFASPDLPLAELVVRYVEDSVRNRDMHRLFVRESLVDGSPPEVEGQLAVQEHEIADLKRRKAKGEIAEDLDPAILLLVLQAAVSAGVTFPGNARRLTGLDPASQDFAERFGDQLRRIVRRLAR